MNKQSKTLSVLLTCLLDLLFNLKMPKLPIIRPVKFINILNKIGFVEVRQKGSHRFFYRKSDNKATVIPIHNKDIGRGLTRKILNEINLSVNEFVKLLH